MQKVHQWILLINILSDILADRIGSHELIMFSLLITATGAALACQASNIYLIVLSFIFLALAAALSHPSDCRAASGVLSLEHTSMS